MPPNGKSNTILVFETSLDPATGETRQFPRRTPFLINYSVGGDKFEKRPSPEDIRLLKAISDIPVPAELPMIALPDSQMSRVGRMATTRVEHVSHFFLPRQAQALAALWRRVEAVPDHRLRNALFFFAEQAIWGMSVLNRYSPSHFSQVNRALNGVYYIASQISEVEPLVHPRRQTRSPIEGLQKNQAAPTDISGHNWRLCPHRGGRHIC